MSKMTLNYNESSFSVKIPNNLTNRQIISLKCNPISLTKPQTQFKTRSILQHNSSMRNYWKKNLFKSFSSINNILSAGSSYTNRKILSPSEINKLSKARDLVKDVIENYKEEYFKNRDLFK